MAHMKRNIVAGPVIDKREAAKAKALAQRGPRPPRVAAGPTSQGIQALHALIHSTLSSPVPVNGKVVVVDEAAYAATSSKPAYAAALNVLSNAADKAATTQELMAVKNVVDAVSAANAVRTVAKNQANLAKVQKAAKAGNVNAAAVATAVNVAAIADMKNAAAQVANGMMAGDIASLKTAKAIADAADKGNKRAVVMSHMVGACCDKCAAQKQINHFVPQPFSPAPRTPALPNTHPPRIPVAKLPGMPVHPQQPKSPGQPMQPQQPRPGEPGHPLYPLIPGGGVPGQPMQPKSPTSPRVPASPNTPYMPPAVARPTNPAVRMPAVRKPAKPLLPFVTQQPTSQDLNAMLR